MPPIYHRRPRVILLKYEIRIAVLHLPGCTSASNRAMKVTGSGREQLCNPRGASSSRRPDHNSSRSATWPLIFVSFRHSLRNPETGRLEGVSHPRGSRSPRVLTPEASRVRPTVPDLLDPIQKIERDRIRRTTWVRQPWLNELASEAVLSHACFPSGRAPRPTGRSCSDTPRPAQTDTARARLGLARPTRRSP